MTAFNKLITPPANTTVEIITTDSYAPPIHIEVSETAEYRLYSEGGTYRTITIYKGIPYPGRAVVKATDSSGNAIAAGKLWFIY